MKSLYGKNLTDEDIRKYFGSPDQFGGITEVEYIQGKARGSRALLIKNGTGLNFTVLPDRSLDIATAEYRGRPVAWLSKNGIVAPGHYENSINGFLRSFSGGLLTTCGLTQAGASGTDGDDVLGIHGRISHTPAESFFYEEHLEEGLPVYTVKGKVRESCLYAENLVMEREIKCRAGSSEIEIFDKFVNAGFEKMPFMLLYHVNFGFPVVSENSGYYTRAVEVKPWTDSAINGNGEYERMESPQPGYEYECFLHEMPEKGHKVYSAVINESLNFGAYLVYSPEELPFFNEWKMMGCQDYVAAFEPGNCIPEGRMEARENGRLKYLEAGETYSVSYKIGVADGLSETVELKKALTL